MKEPQLENLFYHEVNKTIFQKLLMKNLLKWQVKLSKSMETKKRDGYK